MGADSVWKRFQNPALSNHSILTQILTFHLIAVTSPPDDSDWFRRRPWDTWPCAASPPSVSITPPSYTLYSQPSRGVRSRRSVRVCVTAGRRRRRHPDSLSVVVGKLTLKCAGHRPPFYLCVLRDFSLVYSRGTKKKEAAFFSWDPPLCLSAANNIHDPPVSPYFCLFFFLSLLLRWYSLRGSSQTRPRSTSQATWAVWWARPAVVVRSFRDTGVIFLPPFFLTPSPALLNTPSVWPSTQQKEHRH